MLCSLLARWEGKMLHCAAAVLCAILYATTLCAAAAGCSGKRKKTKIVLSLCAAAGWAGLSVEQCCSYNTTPLQSICTEIVS